MAVAADAPALAVSVAECKAYMRIERDEEDAVIAGILRTSVALCEAFTGQWLVVRNGEQRLARDGAWQRILAVPTVAVTGVSDGSEPIAGDRFETDVDAAGNGWVRLFDTALTAPVVRYRAGLGMDWNGVPEPLRQGIVRLVAHLFTHRDAADAGPPPAAVAAMWRPWRLLRLG